MTSGKRARRIRRAAKRIAWANYPKWFEAEVVALPFRERLRLAWLIVKGKQDG